MSTSYRRLVNETCDCGRKAEEVPDKIIAHKNGCAFIRHFTLQNLLYFELLACDRVNAIDGRLTGEMTNTRDEIKQELGTLRSEFQGELTSLKEKLGTLKSEMTEIKGLIGDFIQLFKQAGGETK